MTDTEEIASLRAELAQIRKETDLLKRDMRALTRFITIEYDDDQQPTNINLRCCVLSFAHPEVPGRMQMFMGATSEGPFISLWDSKEKGRVFLSVEKDDPRITLHTAELKDAVVLRADPADGRGLIAALDNGQPRALIKAAPDGAGVVACVHDDGNSRVFLRGSEDEGSLHVVSMDMKSVIKLTSTSRAGGGTLTLNTPAGNPAVILGYEPKFGGCVIVNNAEGKIAASLPDPDKLRE